MSFPAWTQKILPTIFFISIWAGKQNWWQQHAAVSCFISSSDSNLSIRPKDFRTAEPLSSSLALKANKMPLQLRKLPTKPDREGGCNIRHSEFKLLWQSYLSTRCRAIWVMWSHCFSKTFIMISGWNMAEQRETWQNTHCWSRKVCNRWCERRKKKLF